MRTGVLARQCDARGLVAKAGSVRTFLEGKELFGRFGYLMATQALLLIGGIGYWAYTARMIAPHDIGLVSAVVSTSALLSGIGSIGIGTLLIVELRNAPENEHRLIVGTAAAVAGAIVGVLGIGTLTLSRFLGPSWREISHNSVDGALFVAAGVLVMVGAVYDATSIGLRRSPIQLARNGIVTLGRLVLAIILVHFGQRDATALLIALVAANGLSLLVAPRMLGFEPLAKRHVRTITRVEVIRRYWTIALQHHALNLAITSVSYFLPFIAALIARPHALAYFAVAQLVAATVLMPPALLAMSLFAEGAADEGALHRNIRRTLPVGFGCSAITIAILEPFASDVLGVFGPLYAHHSAVMLRLLVLGGIPYVVKDHYVSIRRTQGRLTEAAGVVAIATLLEIGGAAIGGCCFGLTGLCAGWAIATYLEAARFVPVIWRIVRNPDKGGADAAATTPRMPATAPSDTRIFPTPTMADKHQEAS